jgi:hypothetical protein
VNGDELLDRVEGAEDRHLVDPGADLGPAVVEGPYGLALELRVFRSSALTTCTRLRWTPRRRSPTRNSARSTTVCVNP